MKKTQMKLGSLLMAVLMVVSLLAPMGKAQVAEAATTPKISFSNVSDEGMNQISLTDERTFEATVKLAKGTTSKQAKALAKEAAWSLSRTKGIMSTEDYPNQYLGGKLKEWKTFFNNEAFFYGMKTTSFKKNGAYYLKLTFKNHYFYDGIDGIDGRKRSQVRSTMLSFVGDFKLRVTNKKGKKLGETTVRVNPYDSYRVNSQYEKELIQASDYAAKRSDLYTEVRNMGTTSKGYNMPYILISDSKATLTNWEELCDKMLENPDAVIEDVKNDKVDYKIPVLYSNVHADETPGADAPMNFIWDIVKSDKTNNKIKFQYIKGFKEEGKAQLEKEMAAGGNQWSELFKALKNGPTGVGFIQDGKGTSDVVDMEKYYEIETVELDVQEALKKVFFIVVPEENGDARTVNTRNNGNGFDLNRDNMYQTQQETRYMTSMIAHWNPSLFLEFHGFVGGFQIEPCTPPHEPNIDWDLFVENGIAAGEAFGNGAICNNAQFNSFRMPARDYFYKKANAEAADWNNYVWDDMSSSYTPQYALLHGCVSFTIEVPEGNEAGTKALEYGCIAEAKYAVDNAKAIFLNQLEVYSRGVNGIDSDETRKYFVDHFDNAGAEADTMRPKYAENNSFFPEYYVIPVDMDNQQDTDSAYEVEEHLFRNGVKVSVLTDDVTLNGKTYKAGSFVVDMHQAKRNVANNVLYSGVTLENWVDLYSEPITSFSQTRGFDMDVITTPNAFKGKLETLKHSVEGTTLFEGVKNRYVVISNNSVDAIKAVNTLLADGRGVAYVEKGTYKGDFVVTYKNFLKVKNDFVLQAKGVKNLPEAKMITKQATVFVAGEQNPFMYGEYSLKNYFNIGNSGFNWDRFAYGKQMGFNLTTDASKADIIVSSQALEDADLELVKNGKPLLVTGYEYYFDSLADVKALLPDFEYGYGYGAMEDALAHIEYVGESMVTDKYVAENDTIMYGFGGHFISKVPEGANVLIKATKDHLLEGFMCATSLDDFLGSIQAFEYNKNGLDLTVFANTLVNKCHQQDDYRYASNTIFSKVLGEAATADTLR